MGGGNGSSRAQMPAGGFFPDQPQLGELIRSPWNMDALFGGGQMVQAPPQETIFDRMAAQVPQVAQQRTPSLLDLFASSSSARARSIAQQKTNYDISRGRDR